jgi:L-fucose isomerase-like protein
MSAFGYLVVASPLHDAHTVERVTEVVRSQLAGIGGRRVAEPGDRPDEPFAILVATGGTEAQILEQVAKRRASTPFEPVLLVAHALHNSLPAALEAMARLRQTGVRGRIIQLGSVGPLATAVADVTAIHRFHCTRLGLVGEPSPWLVASVPDPDAVRELWGVDVVAVDIAGTIDGHRHASAHEARAVAVHFSGTAPPSHDLMEAAKLHPALTAAIDSAQVDSVTVRCFDYLGALGTSGCVALARLNDTGVVAGCEGDVAGAMAMLLARILLDQPSWIANPASIDVEHDRLLLAHCTVAPSLVEHVELHTHFESGIGVGLRGRFAPGPVTLLRFGGSALEEHWIAEGEIERSGSAEDLCRTQVLIHLDSGGSAESLLDAPLGNHLVLVHGRHRERIERWFDLAFG